MPWEPVPVGLERIPPPPLMPDAACRQPGVDPNWWFPPRKGPESKTFLQAARAVCAACPHQQPCADYAIAAGARLWGVWGGLSVKQRVLIRRQIRQPAA